MRFSDILMVAASQGGGVDPDAAAWASAVVANGGSVSAGRLAIVGQFIAAEKASGAWQITDDYVVLWAENAAQALTSLKQRRLATVVNSPAFTQDRGYTFDGATNYIDTGFIPSSHAVAMSANSSHIEAYCRTNVSTAAANTTAGVASTSNRILRVNARSASDARGSGISSQGTFTLPSATSAGLTQMGRSGSLATDAYGARNGVDMTRTADPTSLGASLPVDSIYIGGLNTSGVYGNGRADSVGFVAWGAALSSAQRLARYNAVQALATAVGAQV